MCESQARTSQHDWDSYIVNQDTTSPESSFQPWFDQWLPKNNQWRVLEIGACPGVHLASLACSHGYHPVALDFHDGVYQLPERFAGYGIPDLQIIHEDFFSWVSDEQFDVVMSLGFVEHFDDPQECMQRHWELVAPGGYLFVGLPIMGPAQLALRRLVLKRDRLDWVLRTHNLKTMNMKKMRAMISPLNSGDEILMSDYIFEMQTWFGKSDPDVRPGRNWVLSVWNTLSRIPAYLKCSSQLFSPYGLLIVRKDLHAEKGNT